MCFYGDGYGGSEIKLLGRYTKQECIDAVRRQYPNANGAKMSRYLQHRECYAEFGMKDWRREEDWKLDVWKSCMFVLTTTTASTAVPEQFTGPEPQEKPGNTYLDNYSYVT